MAVLKKDVKIGHYYVIRHHDDGPHKLSVIRIEGESIYGGWNATKLKTNRTIRIRSAQKLRGEVIQNPKWAPGVNLPKWLRADGNVEFLKGRRYRLTILPAGARTKTITFDANYLGEQAHDPTTLEFDCRPEMGTQQIRRASVKKAEDIGKAVWAR